MGRTRRTNNPCSHPGCKEPVTHDLTLTHREYQVYHGVKVKSKVVLQHLYLCDKHAADMEDFMEVYSEHMC